jgi:hypothetical protein
MVLALLPDQKRRIIPAVPRVSVVLCPHIHQQEVPRLYTTHRLILWMVLASIADPGCLSRIPDPTFFHLGSRIRTVSIPDPGSASKNLNILTPKKPKKWFKL